jgi:hypothetical protein
MYYQHVHSKVPQIQVRGQSRVAGQPICAAFVVKLLVL